ncbi:unnamed protein product [Colias eurytheme]|nr:unnamed protein product [Colias eurytheme]
MTISLVECHTCPSGGRAHVRALCRARSGRHRAHNAAQQRWLGRRSPVATRQSQRHNARQADSWPRVYFRIPCRCTVTTVCDVRGILSNY